MAEVNPSHGLFMCSICLDLLKNPVTLNCGHNYCKGCINRFWDHEDQTGIYSCPQCRQTFTPRPILNKNTVFAELVDQIRKTGLHAPVRFLAGPELFKGEEDVNDTAAMERTEKQKQLKEIKKQFQQKLQEREKIVQAMWQALDTLKRSAQTTVVKSERIFHEMICCIERRRSDVAELIRAQEKAEVSRVEGLLKRLEQEIAELKQKDTELEQLAYTKEDTHFLENFQLVTTEPQSMDLTSLLINQSPSFEAVLKSVSTLKDQLEHFCQQDVMTISTTVSHVQAVSAEPVTREEFLKYSCHFQLDPDTAHRNLQLSEGNTRVEYRTRAQSYPDHPTRFNLYYQVLCCEAVFGRCYWEVERSGVVDVAVSYKSFSRCAFGWNDQSWSLVPSSTSSSFWHNSKETKIPVCCSRIGVYVDQEAGTLAFYSISDTMTLLHRIQTTFTDALYPGFCVGPCSSVKLL